VEQWQESRHSQVIEFAAQREDCAPCHEGRVALEQKFYETSNYLEKDGEQLMPITCAVCHDPHGTEYPGNLRGDVEVSSLDHLCVRCHARSGQPPSRRGPHAAQGLLLLDEDVGWRPAGFESPVVNAHAGLANPKLCVTCHVTRFSVTEPEVFESVGHRFEAISCLDENGIPVDGPCGNEERDFRACAGCHGSEEAALEDYEKRLAELNGWLDQLWVDSDENAVMDETDEGLLPMVVAMGDPEELDPSDELVTVAEGALFNAQLAYTSERTYWSDFEVFDVSVSAHKASGNGAHNPWLLEALLRASIDAVIERYGLEP
jgi:predicted CXXCH cytochrome family protein